MDKFIAAIIVIAILLVLIAVEGWILMLLIGALGHIFGVKELYISFWGGIVVGFALTVIASFFKKN